jgi:hypothetical protein
LIDNNSFLFSRIEIFPHFCLIRCRTQIAPDVDTVKAGKEAVSNAPVPEKRHDNQESLHSVAAAAADLDGTQWKISIHIGRGPGQ